ncbi:hypothetical protein BGZ83_001983 [Gryganskiella cystojenkinii]|nr:hypothetical protein BGZ83_001983 [Gryganskiella cystojenkinii]
MSCNTIRLGVALLAFCAASISFTQASPLIGSAPSGGPGGPRNSLGSNVVVNPITQATTTSNLIANTDIAPQVNVAPTIPIPYPQYYGVPVPVASSYPVPVTTAFKKRWDDDCCCDDDDDDDDDCCCDDDFFDDDFRRHRHHDFDCGFDNFFDDGFGFPTTVGFGFDGGFGCGCDGFGC